jgi:uncharacterized protein (DUF2252 family)
MCIGSIASRRVAASVTTLAALLWASSPALASRARTAEVVAAITSVNAGLSASARAEKFALMKDSPLAFFRGSNHLYWKDLGSSPMLARYGGQVASRALLSGDAHVFNFGAYDDDQGDVVYAIDDFDEAVIGDYQLDVWRAAISIVLVARANGGFSIATQSTLIDAFTEAYLDAMASYATSNAEISRKFLASNTYGLLDDFLLTAATKNNRVKMLDAWTAQPTGMRRFDTAGNAQLASVSAAVDSDVRAHIATYRTSLSGGTSFPASFFAVKSVAQRLHAGLGSIGSNRYYILVEGPSSSQSDDLILDMKAQGTPSAAPYLDPGALAKTHAASGGNAAYRTVLAYKALGYRVDDFLGYTALSDGQQYSVRERSPYKETFDTSSLTTLARLQHLAEQWGQVLATQHARADRDWDAVVFPGSVDAQIAGLTNGDHAGFRALVRTLALDYADQVALDHASFLVSF